VAVPRRVTDRRRRRGLALALAGAVTISAGSACRRAESLPVLGTVPPFTLTERSGRVVGADDLRGTVWVADFVFTRCPDICPVLSARMSTLQEPLATGDDPIRLVSISVDPVHDTPAVLSAYAGHYRVGPNWLFLTGARDMVAALLRDGFRVAFADDGPPTSPITHSDRFVLVDRQLRIRGYYHGNDQTDLDRLLVDARAVRAERPS
jgi:protein SCO1